MEAREEVIAKIEDKIRTLGERLVASDANNASFQEEISALKNKITDLEKIVDQTSMGRMGPNVDQIDTIRRELDGYISEVSHCIELVKEM